MELKDLHYGGIYLDVGNELFRLEHIFEDGTLLGYVPEDCEELCPIRIDASSLVEERTQEEWDAAASMSSI